MCAPLQDETADPAIGNVTGSNAVNVFLGVGLSWLIGAVVQDVKYNRDFAVDAGSLAFAGMAVDFTHGHALGLMGTLYNMNQ